jgi:hypothetical protein
MKAILLNNLSLKEKLIIMKYKIITFCLLFIFFSCEREETSLEYFSTQSIQTSQIESVISLDDVKDYFNKNDLFFQEDNCFNITPIWFLAKNT